MLSAEECIAKAKALSERAAQDPILSTKFLELAEEWLRLSETAEWQDAFLGVENTPGPPKGRMQSLATARHHISCERHRNQ